ncbi:MAG: hypothetical protein A7316_06325 [Candidatus Altiarchaeales archaeon WOR_SM1_86-2]|nr:MAG: hypothetical protein A7316_06325 [Candidatus Altiarchaeales archaeon WOR_SM1_86-2]ODS40414.1 MAG: hypothetical protein A7315_08635 [Candidatus Altiarchaeales archaeon WOR_SM1_79]
MIEMKNVKVVQTKLGASEYAEFKNLAKRFGLNIKDALRNAVELWMREKTHPEDDPLLRLKPVDYGDDRVSERVDEILYGLKK